MSKNDLKRRSGEGSGNGILFKDIDVLTKALYEDKTHPRSIINSTASSRSKAIVKPHLPETKSKSKINNEDRFLKDKKSIWSWNTFKSFTHVRNKRFNCCFSLQVHSIEGLPPSFDNLTLCVKWKRRDGELTTHPAPVSQGVAEFEELLTNTCSVYGSRSGPHHSAKYEAKHFLLYASVYGDPELDLGKHRVDLTRLLPLTLEELEDEKSSGKWSTTYRLSGKAKGASMNVSFGYSVVDNIKSPTGQSQMKRGESLPVNSRSYNRSVEDIKDLHEVFPVSKSELSESVSMLYKKLDEDKSTISVDYETKRDVQDFDTPAPEKSEFSILEQGIEFSVKEKATPEHDIKAYEEEEGTLKDQRFDEKELIMQELELALNNVNEVSDSQEESENLKEDEEEGTSKDQSFDEKELIMQELELALNNVNEDSDSQEESENPKEDEEGLKGTETESVAGFEYEENENMEVKISYKEKGKALKLDHATEVVAEDFLNMLGIDHSPFSLTSESESNSPRERLLRQFEKDALTNGSSLFNFNLDDDDDFICDSSSTSMLPEEHNKTKASIMEDMESEALMREWGLNEKVFESSTKSQVEFSPEEPLELPPLGDNLGPFVETSNGGFLRSMSPEIFKNGKNGGNLIMQVSSPVVVPAEMGSGVMDVLQGLASVGIEKLSFQANKLMPLEDISGKTIQQIALEQESSSSIVGKSQSQSQRSRKYDLGDTDPEYVSLEDLAPLAMNKIEALSMEGLRIQSGMSDNEAPSNVSPKSIGEVSALEGKRVNLGTGGLQLLDVKNNGGNDGHNDDDGMDGMMGLSVSLDEWMRLDSGEIDESERTSRILTAHHASDVARVKRGGKNKKGGLLGNNFTVALMVQLRDPLRNFEPVGTPMLALVQVERVFVPPKPKIHSSIYWRKPEEEEEEEEDEVKVKDVEEDKKVVVVEEESVLVPQFKVVDVHVAGVKNESESVNEGGKKGIWGWGSNAKQEKAGSRWLVANGMGKKNGKHPLMKSKAADKSCGGGGSLWSVSSKGKGKGKVDPPVTVRNPNVIIPNETVRLLSGAGFL
ncbi:unnamed protein product [Lactuca saligna]|uniref:C2 NT-type domain-containing protein n=1 Tax=Lactuca saligna TaxID=75948 RepID=A0AA35ZIC0_LACSI|nr:unnamed protein product [Lactuca saligna]